MHRKPEYRALTLNIHKGFSASNLRYTLEALRVVLRDSKCNVVFLQEVSGENSRYARVGLSPTRFHLPMTRGDIGEYLGLTVETVSRLFTALQKKGLISVDNREIALLAKDELRAIVGADEL
jgi:CRP-like cAMP-binding protein